VPSLTDEELKRIGERADHFAFVEQALGLGASMGTSEAISLAVIDALEDVPRELHRKKAQRDRSREEEALRRFGVGR
jgi:hypothetical protein